MVAVLSCPLGRRTSDLPWAPHVVISSPHTETPVPEGQYSPLPTFRRGKGVGTEKGFSKALARVGGGEGGGLLASGALLLGQGRSPGAALCLPPLGAQQGHGNAFGRTQGFREKRGCCPRT